MKPIQLNRYLAICGVASRRKAVEPIIQGRVTVNDQIIQEPGTRINPEIDTVLLDAKQLVPAKRKRYILMNKPPDVITAVEDDRGRQTVLDLVNVKDRLFTVGRLDFDTTGVLLLTNDGELTYRLTHPSYQIDKVYEAWVDGQLGDEAIHKLKKGVEIDPEVIVRGESRIVSKEKNRTCVSITVHEGKKRQIKRMLKAVGFPVVQLERICFAGLTVGELKPGEWRDLNQQEIGSLHQLTGLTQ